MRRILGACIFDFSSTICVSSLFVVGNRVVSDAYKMRAFLCDTRTWGRGSAPLERGHRPCRLSWDKKGCGDWVLPLSGSLQGWHGGALPLW